MQKAAEDLKRKQEEEAAEKRKIIDARVPKLTIEGMGQGGQQSMITDVTRMHLRAK